MRWFCVAAAWVCRLGLPQKSRNQPNTPSLCTPHTSPHTHTCAHSYTHAHMHTPTHMHSCSVHSWMPPPTSARCTQHDLFRCASLAWFRCSRGLLETSACVCCCCCCALDTLLPSASSLPRPCSARPTHGGRSCWQSTTPGIGRKVRGAAPLRSSVFLFFLLKVTTAPLSGPSNPHQTPPTPTPQPTYARASTTQTPDPWTRPQPPSSCAWLCATTGRG